MHAHVMTNTKKQRYKCIFFQVFFITSGIAYRLTVFFIDSSLVEEFKITKEYEFSLV